MRPFLKWAGNKYTIRQHILATLPEGKRLIEPFMGSGAIFLNTHYEQYVLAEKNPDLVDLFKFIQQEGDSFIQDCLAYFCPKNNCAEKYNFYRDTFNQTLGKSKYKRKRAMLFVYLNRHGYNGLCRYNNQGYYNVPFGRYIKPTLSVERMNFFHQKSQHAIFELGDFRQTLTKAKKGDVVYCDPPYVPLTSSFPYVPGYFSLKDQEDLAKIAEALSQQGICVIISNHDTPKTREYYKNARIHSLSVPRQISCKSNNRNQATEINAVYDSTKII